MGTILSLLKRIEQVDINSIAEASIESVKEEIADNYNINTDTNELDIEKIKSDKEIFVKTDSFSSLNKTNLNALYEITSPMKPISKNLATRCSK